MAIRDLWKKLTERGERSVPAPAAEAEPSLETVLVERLAAHFPGAVVSDQEVSLPFGGLKVTCELSEIGEMGAQRSAALYFWISGGPFDDGPVFASVSGYGATPLEAVVMGCCNWACAFAPVLRAGVGEPPQADIEAFEIPIDGQPMRVFIAHLDRAATTETSEVAPEDAIREARERLGQQGWLLRRVIESGTLPVLRADRPVLLSAFVLDGGSPPRLVEVKVNGGDWPPAHAPLAAVRPGPSGAFPFLRELAIAVPLGPQPPLRRAALERTLRGLVAGEGGASRRATDWRGFRSHGGRLDAPLSSEELHRLEALIPGLPEDYKAFLHEVGGAGAGPGYGLLDPRHSAHRPVVAGPEAPGPALALAHGGCGVMWLLMVEGPNRGEVWVDARCADGTLRRVESSFAAWYRRWLDSAVRDALPWSHWDSDACATTHLLAQLLEKLAKEDVPEKERPERLRGMLGVGSIRLQAAASEFFEQGDGLDPCGGCVALAARFGLHDDVFATGAPPRQRRWAS